MATHSSTLDWEIPRTEEPGVLQSPGSQTAGYDLVNKKQRQQQRKLVHGRSIDS